MADGIACKHCGFEETAHNFKDDFSEDANEKKPGYKKTLNNCSGYVSEDPYLARRLKKAAEDEALARAMREAGNLGD
jgi:hypothetical protein